MYKRHVHVYTHTYTGIHIHTYTQKLGLGRVSSLMEMLQQPEARHACYIQLYIVELRGRGYCIQLQKEAELLHTDKWGAGLFHTVEQRSTFG